MAKNYIVKRIVDLPLFSGAVQGTEFVAFQDPSTFVTYRIEASKIGGADKVGEAPIDGQQYARKDGGWEAVESSNLFEETLVFRDIEVFEFTKSQSFKITEVVAETGVTASIKLHGTNTNYVINNTVPAFNRLDISVDVLGAITIKGILV